MYKMLKDAKADIMLSGGRSQFIALKASMPWLDIIKSVITPIDVMGMVKLCRGSTKRFTIHWEQVS